MKHLGDITKLNGALLPVVDIITGGSPCQDLSVAGKRAGLAGERSGLFMEQIRIIKEMREHDRATSGRADEYIRPRYMVWENVPGAFSSNHGEDFLAVLEETAKVADKNAVIPRPTGGWTPSGAIMGNGWSIAWRVHDAQFWGVPQRRKRIALVADFGGETAPEILFEREGVPRNTAESGETGKTVTGAVTDSPGASISFQERGGKPGGVKEYLFSKSEPEHCQHSITNPFAQTLTANNANVSQRMPDKDNFNAVITTSHGGFMCNADDSGIAHTLQATDYKDPQIVTYGIDQQGGKGGANYTENLAPTLASNSHGTPHGVCYGLDRASFNQGQNALYDFSVQEELAQTIVARGPGG